MLQPAARESGGEKIMGVSTHGLGGSGVKEPIVRAVCFSGDALVIMYEKRVNGPQNKETLGCGSWRQEQIYCV